MSAEITPGQNSSEYKLAKLASHVGIGMIVLGAVEPALYSLVDAFPDVRVLSILLTVCGTVLKVGAVLGYSRSRAQVKAAAVTAKPAPAE